MFVGWIPSLIISWILSRSQFLESSIATLLPLSSPQESSHHDLFQSAQKVRKTINTLVREDCFLAGQFVRLAFHDATTRDNSGGGPNASVRYELDWSENRGLAKPLRILEEYCKESHLSFADIIALAGAQAIEAVGGPSIAIRLGRTDAKKADPQFLQQERSASTPRSIVTKTLPSAGLDSDGLRLYFRNLQLSEPEWVALTGGSHGLGRHVSLLGMPRDCLRNLTRTCLEEAPVLLPFVTDSVCQFDTTYFQALLLWNDNQIQMGKVAFIPTDVAMVVDPGLRKHVQRFAADPQYFRRSFTTAYQKLVETTATTAERY